MIIVSLIYFYSGKLASIVLLAPVFAVLAYAMLAPGVLPVAALDLCQVATIFIFTGSRVPQIWTNFKNKSTGSLAALTIFLSFAGGCARIFTTLQEVNDPLGRFPLSLTFILPRP